MGRECRHRRRKEDSGAENRCVVVVSRRDTVNPSGSSVRRGKSHPLSLRLAERCILCLSIFYTVGGTRAGLLIAFEAIGGCFAEGR